MGIYRLSGLLIISLAAFSSSQPLPAQDIEVEDVFANLEHPDNLQAQLAKSSPLPYPLQAEISSLTLDLNSPITSIAQVPSLEIPEDRLPGNVLPQGQPPSERLPPVIVPEPLPSPEELLEPTAPDGLPQPGLEPQETPQTIFVERFEVEGSTVFDADDLSDLAWLATALDSDELIPDLIRPYTLSYCPDSVSAPDSRVASQELEEPVITASPPSPSLPPDAQATSETATQEVSTPEAGQDLTFEQLLRARTAITQLYIECDFITSGAILPPQEPENNIVQLRVIEGRLEDIEVLGTQRLNPGYVESRLALVTNPPLNQQRLLEGLQLLQLDPLIQRITAELQAGTRPSTNILEVTVAEADPFSVDFIANNNSSPSIGSFSRGVQLNHLNVLGSGDGLSIEYSNTDGSNEVDVGYVIPLNPRNGTLSLAYGNTNSWVIEPPFDILDIQSESNYYELTYRQPLYQVLTEEFALALTFSRQESQTRIGFDDIGPFPISPGADEKGRTEISAIRFTQEWFKRSGRQVLAARSQFSLGVDWFGATTNPVGPSSQFFAWRGQAQWVQLLKDDTPLIIRTDMQFTPDPLFPLEQFGLGGLDTIRGYRQDALLTDNGVLASAEVRLPLLQVSEVNGILQLTPFIDFGTGWNVESKNPDPNTLAGAGLGLLWRQDDYLIVRLDWGIPLISNSTRKRTWQESGVYFSIVFNTF